jgi:hypothetical protein
MTDLETGYLIVGFLFIVSSIGLLCIVLDMFFNKEEKARVIKPKYEPIVLAEFLSDEDDDQNLNLNF